MTGGEAIAKPRAKVETPATAESAAQDSQRFEIALLTGGGDKPYALGLAFGLLDAGQAFAFLGSDDLDVPELRRHPRVQFHNVRGNQNPSTRILQKMARVLVYYARLIAFAARTEAKILHLLWNNKFEIFDRTLLMIYYRLLGKRLVMTVHNVNKAARDGCDGALNRWSLRVQYGLCDHLFVHTRKMKEELADSFGIPAGRVSVIPFGINNTVPESDIERSGAKRLLGLEEQDKAILFFGNIAPYKGLEHLVEAMVLLSAAHPDYRMIIAGRPKGCESYWESIRERIRETGLERQAIERIEYIPDQDIEAYFKAADVLVLPYTQIFQSGVLFLAYNFGLPAIAADVGSLREDILEGQTGLICRPADPQDLARALKEYFSSDLYHRLEQQRPAIRNYAREKYSWAIASRIIGDVYGAVLRAGKGTVR